MNTTIIMAAPSIVRTRLISANTRITLEATALGDTMLRGQARPSATK
jgi:hypothetical protein